MEIMSVELEDNLDQSHEGDHKGQPIRVILADTQAIFRAGLRKILALEDDFRVVGQAETLVQTVSAAKKFSADVLMFEASLAPNPVEVVSDLLRQCANCKLVVVIQEPNEELTLELFRRGAHGIVSRDVEPELLVQCLRKVAQGEPWLDNQAVNWVLEAYRTQATRPISARTKVELTPKESLIVSCVTQGMKNKENALRVGTTEQVVKTYLRKVYDKLGVADRLELALYCLNHHVVDNTKVPPLPPTVENNKAAGAAAASGASPEADTTSTTAPAFTFPASPEK